MSYLPGSILSEIQPLAQSSQKTFKSQRLLIQFERKKASQQRLLKESQRPKLVLYNKWEREFAPSRYIKQARERYLQRTQRSESPHTISRNQSESKFRLKSKLVPLKKPAESDLSYPKWLLNKPNFQPSGALESDDVKVDKIVEIDPHLRTEAQQESLINWLLLVRYFRSLPKSIVLEVSRKLILKEYQPGEILILIGQEADFLYIIYSGKIGVVIDNQEISTIGPKKTIGEIAFEASSKRTATCIAHEFTQTFALDRTNYKFLIQSIKKLEKIENTKLIMSIAFFNNWTPFKIEALSTCLFSKKYKKGEVIYEKGTDSNSFIILKTGKVKLQTFVDIEQQNRWPDGLNKWKIRMIHKKYVIDVSTVKPRMFIGEIDLIDKSPRRTRAVAIKKSECAVLNKREFFEIFSLTDYERMRELNKFQEPSSVLLQEQVLQEIRERKNKQNALLDAMQVDITSVGGRELPFDAMNCKLKRWVRTMKERIHKNK